MWAVKRIDLSFCATLSAYKQKLVTVNGPLQKERCLRATSLILYMYLFLDFRPVCPCRGFVLK